MVNLRIPILVCTAALGFLGSASAQGPAATASTAIKHTGAESGAAPTAAHPPHPLIDAAPSALASYQAYVDTPVLPWRESNDRVHAVGGWRAYARQVQAATTSPKEPKP